MNKNEFEREKEKIEQTIAIVKQILQDENLDLKKLYNDFALDREELWRIADRKKLHISNLEVAQDKPYFARIDFASEEDGKTSTIYIGKNGVMKDTDIIVTDWRAPISSLYYDAEVGKCGFEAPDGRINGEMLLKRQYEIENGELQEYFDVDLVSNDGLLQKYLNDNNDARLKSIVSTIQKEQNDVIRKNLSDNIIVQGVAGSGKTTVALHRIAYLVYNYINSIKQNQYLVIGPNPVFLKYIKSVLPELDVDGVEQCTYEMFAKKYIDEDININPSNKKVIVNISGKNKNDIDKFKCSMKYKDMLDRFLALYFYSITSKPLMLGNFQILSSEEMANAFKTVENNYSNNLSNRIELTIDRLCRVIEDKQNEIMSNYSEYSFELFKTASTDEEKNKMRSIFSKERTEISKNCRSSLRKYFNKSKVNATKLYKLFLSTISDFDIYNYPYLSELKKETTKNIKGNNYDFEDLASLIYIKRVISLDKDYEKIRHVVIDEAQDLGEFNFYSLKSVLPNATFSIFCDLAQSIYDYRGINSWEEVNNSMFKNNGNIINFNKSYRTTVEIMNVADDVAESIGLGRSDLVVRHGEVVLVSEIEEEKNIPEYINLFLTNSNTLKYDLIAKTNNITIYSKDKDKVLDYFHNKKINVKDSYEYSKDNYIDLKKESIINTLIVAGVILSISLIEILLMIRSSFLSRIKEVGILRAIGIKKSDIYKMFSGEIFAITIIASIPSITFMTYILYNLVGIKYLENMFMVNIFTFLLSIILVLLFNLVVGLLPVFNTIRKTPAEILLRFDVD